MSISDAVVRLSVPGAYATGLLVTPELIDRALASPSHHFPVTSEPVYGKPTFFLSARHFLPKDQRDGDVRINVMRRGLSRVVQYCHPIPKSDLGVGMLNQPAPRQQLMPITSALPKPRTRTVTFGYAGQSNRITTYLRPTVLTGRVIGPLPFAISNDLSLLVRNCTLISPDNDARVTVGDSGGPVLFDGHVFALQSMMFSPYGQPTGIAAVSNIRPYLLEIRQAMEMLRNR